MSTPLLNIAQLRTLEKQMEAQLGAGVLMARAGAATAVWVAAQWPERKTRILIVCGPGNNGGDGYACASALAAAGYAPTVVACAASSTHDAQQARAQWSAAHSVLNELPPLEGYALIIDALFGVGLSRALSGFMYEAVQAINAAKAKAKAHVLALDCPSGLDVERGAWVGDIPGVQAHTTLTFIAAKPGLYTGVATDACGEVIVESLGVDIATWVQPAGWLNAPEQFSTVCQPRRHDTHKGTYGAVAVVGGNVGMVGAALLAARAALRLGAGRVYVDAIGAPELRVDPLQPDLMFQPIAQLTQIKAVVLGCGLGQDERARAAFAQALALPVTHIIDADALALLQPDIALTQPAVLTPHPLEAGRLLHCSAAEVQRDRIGAARRLAAQTNSVVVLKGAGTVIATKTHYWINPTGNAALATAGTGDVLAGMIAALVAQGHTALESALAATWLHGAAAQAHGADMGLVAGDVAALAVRVLAQLRLGTQH